LPDFIGDLTDFNTHLTGVKPYSGRIHFYKGKWSNIILPHNVCNINGQFARDKRSQ